MTTLSTALTIGPEDALSLRTYQHRSGCGEFAGVELHNSLSIQTRNPAHLFAIADAFLAAGQALEQAIAEQRQEQLLDQAAALEATEAAEQVDELVPEERGAYLRSEELV